MQDNNNPAAAQETPEISAARLAANRANAQHSSGPTSASGKAKACLNALKTGLTGVTVLRNLPANSCLHRKDSEAIENKGDWPVDV